MNVIAIRNQWYQKRIMNDDQDMIYISASPHWPGSKGATSIQDFTKTL